MRSTHRFALVLATTAIVIGCSGGTTTPQPTPHPPVITAVSPSPDAGAPGEMVTFSAIASESPTAWEWTFAGASATPSTSSAGDPIVTLGPLGTYTGTVRAINAGGTSAPFEFNYRIAEGLHQIATVFHSSLGSEGKPVTFTPIRSGDPTSFDWDFGAGARPPTLIGERPTVELGPEGSYLGSLVARNAVGASRPYTFAYSVHPLLESPIERVTPERRVGDAGTVQRFSAEFTGFGRPRETSNYRWRFDPAETIAGVDWYNIDVLLGPPGWRHGSLQLMTAEGLTRPVEFDYMVERPGEPPSFHAFQAPGTGGLAVLASDICILDGRPAMVYLHSTGPGAMRTLTFTRALTGLPATQADWRSHTVTWMDSLTFIDFAASLDGTPLILTSGDDENRESEILAYTADTLSPSSTAAWLPHRVPTPPRFWQVATGVVGGRHVLALGILHPPYPVVIGTSTINSPRSAADWQFHAALAESTVVPDGPIVDHAGRIAVALEDISTIDSPISLLLSDTGSPAAPSDWSLSRALDSPCSVAGLASLNGRLHLITYCVEQGPHWSQSRNAMPKNTADWEHVLLELGGIGLQVNAVEDHLAIVYQEYTSGSRRTGLAWTEPRSGAIEQDWQTQIVNQFQPLASTVAGGTVLIAVE